MVNDERLRKLKWDGLGLLVSLILATVLAFILEVYGVDGPTRVVITVMSFAVFFLVWDWIVKRLRR